MQSLFFNGGVIGKTLNLGTSEFYQETISTPIGQQAYTTAGTYSWTAPANVTSVSVVCVGGGGGGGPSNVDASSGGGGGGLGWKNSIPVIPGNSYTVVVGSAGAIAAAGGQSRFIDASTVAGNGGSAGVSGTTSGGAGGSFVGDGGGNGGQGGSSSTVDSADGLSEAGAGGGAAGYTGNGGAGGGRNNGGTGRAGAGGGGAGGSAPDSGAPGRGGGVGIQGQGANGTTSSAPGSGGSGVTYGGGGAGADSTTSTAGGGGAVRIIWGGNRAFPSTNTADNAGNSTSLVNKNKKNSGLWNLASNFTVKLKEYADPFLASVTLLLHFDGVNNGTTFPDSSPSAKSIEVFGGATTNTTVTKYGSASGFFNGSTAYLRFADAGAMDFGTGDFTVEAWVYPTSLVSEKGSIISGTGPTNGDFMFVLRSATLLSVGRNHVAWDATTSGVTFNTNTWYHVAVSRTSGVLKIFVDGVQRFSGANTQNYNIQGTYGAVGARQLTSGAASYGELFAGYIDELRVTKGVGRYTVNFTPPTGPF
jgi:hypothetical protein